MVKERYVNFEVAKLLKDKGFDEPCLGFYSLIKKELKFSAFPVSNSQWLDSTMFDSSIIVISAPTQAMACDWLREKHKIHIVLLFMPRKGYVASICDISDLDNLIYMVDIKYYPDIESAYNEALKYVLTNVNYPA